MTFRLATIAASLSTALLVSPHQLNDSGVAAVVVLQMTDEKVENTYLEVGPERSGMW